LKHVTDCWYALPVVLKYGVVGNTGLTPAMYHVPSVLHWLSQPGVATPAYVLLVTVMVCVWLTLLLPASAALLQVRLMRYVALLDVTLRMDCRAGTYAGPTYLYNSKLRSLSRAAAINQQSHSGTGHINAARRHSNTALPKAAPDAP
jgi:hypothetical protein